MFINSKYKMLMFIMGIISCHVSHNKYNHLQNQVTNGSSIRSNCVFDTNKQVKLSSYFEQDTTCLEVKEYKVCIYSNFTRDSIASGEGYGLYPLVKHQIVELTYKGKRVYKRKHDVPSVIVNTHAGQTIKALENAIVEIGIISGKDDKKFFVLDGFGGCTDCSNYMHIINNKGITTFLLYEDKRKIYTSKGGSYPDMIIKSGINNDSFCKRLYPTKTLLYLEK